MVVLYSSTVTLTSIKIWVGTPLKNMLLKLIRLKDSDFIKEGLNIIVGEFSFMLGYLTNLIDILSLLKNAGKDSF